MALYKQHPEKKRSVVEYFKSQTFNEVTVFGVILMGSLAERILLSVNIVIIRLIVR